AVGGRVVVGAGEDVEEAGGELGRLGDPVERPVVGQHVDPQAQDLAFPGGGDLAVHVVVAGKGGRHQVLGAALPPLDRGSGTDAADNAAHVTGVNPDLVAESAADIRGNDLNLLLGKARDQGVQGAVGVGGLGGGPDGQLPGDLVHVGYRA